MKKYKDRTIKTRLMSNPERTSYKLIVKFGDNIREKIFEGDKAHKRAKVFQDNISNLINSIF